ncbi:MAG: flagellar filament capping protein FliD [Desulfamplus sp.]|nr:flagellar filament capping protein FliD [Desulfamplus sp.]
MSSGSITSLGVGSGLELQSMLEQLKAVDQKPIDTKKTKQTELGQKVEEFNSIKSSLLSIRTKSLDLSLGSNFIEKKATVSGTSINATSVSGAREISHNVNVTSLATSSTWSSSGVSSKTASIAATDGTFSYKLGQTGSTISVDISSGTTLQELVDKINSDKSNPGVLATIADTGFGDNPYKLILSSKKSGEENRITIGSQLTGFKLTETNGAGHSPPSSDSEVTISDTEPIDISAANANNEIVFRERLENGELGAERKATIADGNYTNGDDLAAAIKSAMESASTNGTKFSVLFDEDTKKLTIKEDGSNLHELQMEWGKSSAASSLGFDSETDIYKPYDSILNARFTVDGIDYQRQSNNGITDVVSGISLDLKDSGQSSFKVDSDFEKVQKSLEEIISTFNTLATDMSSKSKYDINTGEKGILFGETAVLRIDDELKSVLGQKIDTGGSITSLYDLGLETKEDGSLSLNTKTLQSVLSSNSEDVIKFFTGDSEKGVEGLGDILYDKMTKYTNANGLMTTEIETAQTRINKMDTEIQEDTKRLDQRYESLTKQFVKLDSYMSQMKSQGNFLEQMFSVNNNDNNNN